MTCACKSLGSLNTSSWTWSIYENDSAPFARSGHVLVYHEDYLYVMAGADSRNVANISDTHRFHVTEHTWEDITNEQSYNPVIIPGAVAFNSSLYLFFGWDSVNGNDHSKVYKAQVGEFVWREVSISSSHSIVPRDSFGFTLINSQFYMFGGFTVAGLLNSFVSVDLSVEPLEFVEVPERETPSLRIGHALEPIASDLYLFGGDSHSEKLNDFWKFDPKTEDWSSITSTGTVPSPRSHHATSAFGDSLIVWGGIGSSGYLNDMYRFSVATNTWEQLETVSDLVPTPRISACVALHTPMVYIYGGKTEIGLSAELWQFNTGTHEYTLLSSNNPKGPGHINKQQCVVSVEEVTHRLYVMFGTATADEAKGAVHYYDINEGTWHLEFTSAYARNGALVEKIGRNLVVAGGETWGIYLFDEIVWIDLDTQTESVIGTLDQFFIGGATAYLRSNLYFLGGASPLGDILRATVPQNSFYRLDLKEECPECEAACSLGSTLDNGRCTLCRKGHYADSFNSGCLLCEAGFYNPFEGATTSKQCFPCGQGTYNPDPGASYCLDCPSQATCSIGSSEYVYVTETDYLSSIQPDFYATKEAEAAQVTTYLVLACAIGGVVVLLVFVGWSRARVWLRKLDLFDSQHTHGEGKVVVLTKTMIGGAFSVIFLVVAVILIVSTLPAYFIDNLYETKTLVPFIILENEHTFETELEVTLTLSNYYAPCSSASKECDASINTHITNFLQQSGTALTCERQESDCVVSFYCKTCEIGSSSMLTFDMTHSMSYASVITVNVTSFSSIPEKYSSAIQKVEAEGNYVFRGSPASIFYFSMSPSLYKNSVDNDERTGYHTILNQPADQGSMHETLDVPFVTDLNVEIELIRSENSLMTMRDEKSPLLLLLITLLGSVSGAMGAVGAGMSATESMAEKIEARLAKAKDKRQCKAKREELKFALSSGKAAEFRDLSRCRDRPDQTSIIDSGTVSYFSRKENDFDDID